MPHGLGPSSAAPYSAVAQLRLSLSSPLARGAIFVAILWQFTISLQPFQDLSSRALLELSSGNLIVTYAAVAGLSALSVASIGGRLRHLVPCLGAPPVLALAAWLAVCVALSQDPAGSARRLALCGMSGLLAASLFLLPRNQRELARFIAAFTGPLLVLSYGGVLLAPELTIHQATDLLEPQLAGDWRGVFVHKNGAAAAFAVCVFLGLFVARSRMLLVGLAITAGSALFVVLAGGKSAMMLVVLTIAISLFWARSRSKVLRVAVAMAPLVLLLVLTLGSVLVPALGAFTRSLPVDASFTGRTDIWVFAIDRLRNHLATGYGFQAFWNTEATRYGTGPGEWAGMAVDGHNGYLDTVISLGLPGLVLVLATFVALPMRDYFVAERRQAGGPLLALFLQIWLFGIYLGNLESVFFASTSAIWLIFLLGFLGLRIAARHPLRGLD